tara:strand:- start:121 stop:336 length:216 start_codon:yes stop_codon:yes gene_type:complete
MNNPTNTWHEGDFLIESFPKLLYISKDGKYIEFTDKSMIKMFTWFTDDLTDINAMNDYFENHAITEGLNDD